MQSSKSLKEWIVIAIPYLWLLALFLIPFIIVFKMSLSDYVVARPPYTPTINLAEGWQSIKDAFAAFDFENYVFLSEDDLYIKSYLNSLKIASISTFLTLLIGYPIAYGIARANSSLRSLLLMLVILPFWTSFLIRVYAWIGILKNEGLLNLLFLKLGITDAPIQMINTDFAVYVGIVYSYLPFMILPLYASLEKLDGSLIEAATDLGSTPTKAFWQITFPLSMPGIVAGCFLVFIPAVGEFVIPDLLGSNSTLMIGKTLWTEFFSNRDWTVASAVAVILLLFLIVPIVLFQKHQEREGANL
jgi:putrescine transport system permease protein